jgi:multidrug efflux pump subunit AcrA (membrane-fusion protein)
MAPEGKAVKPGDMILSFDTKEIRERLSVKQSELETAKKELEKIRLVEQETLDNNILQLAEAQVETEKAERKTQLPEGMTAVHELKKLQMDLELAKLNQTLSQSRLDNQRVGMKTRIHTQENKVKKLDKQVTLLRDAMGKMSVKAPKQGMVVYSTDWRGRKKAVGDSCWMGDNILELPDLSRMQVEAVIPEPEAGKVKTGLPVEVRLDSNPDKMYKGEIKSLGRIFRTKSSEQPAIVFDAVITVEDPDPQAMRPGMAAGVDIIVSSRENILQVPEAAIVYRENGLYVWKKSLTGKKLVAVSIGVRSGGMVEVLEGIKENDRLAIPIEGNGGER